MFTKMNMEESINDNSVVPASRHTDAFFQTLTFHSQTNTLYSLCWIK